MKTFYVTVKIQIADNADPLDVIEECDYSFTHEEIIDTEIASITNENDQTVFK